MRYLMLLFAALLAAGCATAPKPLQGEFAATSPRAAPPEGERVRWGGQIVVVEPKPELTCFQVLAKELGPGARPRQGDASEGRFLACREGFYDPAVFTAGREITVVGNLSGRESRRIGDYDYELPRVAADVVYLWPQRYSFDDYYYQPYVMWWPYGHWGWSGPVIRYHRVRHSRSYDRQKAVEAAPEAKAPSGQH